MDKKVATLIRKLNVTVIYDEGLEMEGSYLPTLNLIVINDNLDDFRKLKALLHELGHACEHKDNYELYKVTYALKSKMEFEADEFMIDAIIEEHEGVYNYSQLIEAFDIGLGYDIRYAQ